MKIKDVRAFSEEDRQKQLAESEKELLDLRFKLTTKQLVNHRQVPELKQKIARLKTVMREKELGIR